MSSDSAESFEFLLFEGFSNMVLASALEPLRDVRLRGILGGLDWKISTLDGRPVRSSSQLQIAPDTAFDPSVGNRTLVIVAGYDMRAHTGKALPPILRQAVRGATRVIALDTASWLLAAAGLLDGHRATIHWQELDAFQEQFPNVQVSNARFVRSGPFTTCGGASTAMEMILDLIQDLFGPAAAFDASSMFLYDPALKTRDDRGVGWLRERGSPKLVEALDAMAQAVEHPLTTFELAERVRVSERSLNRIFQRELGMTPGKYYKLFRLQHARYLAQETRLDLNQIALRCGFSCASSLGRSYSAEFGQTLAALRRDMTVQD